MANDLSKKQGCFKTFAFLFAFDIVLFSLFLVVLEKVTLEASTVLYGDFDTPQMYNS